MPCIPDKYLDCYLAETKQSLQFEKRFFGGGEGGGGGGCERTSEKSKLDSQILNTRKKKRSY